MIANNSVVAELMRLHQDRFPDVLRSAPKSSPSSMGSSSSKPKAGNTISEVKLSPSVVFATNCPVPGDV